MSVADVQTLKPEIISDVLTTLYGIYNLWAVVAMLGFDILATFNNEMTYIWKKKIGPVSLLYVTTRYIPFLINLVTLRTLTLIYCIPWFVVLSCTEYLFIVRAVALNGHLRWLHYTLMALFVAEIIGALIIFLPQPSISAHSSLAKPTKNTFLSILYLSGFTQSVAVFGVVELAFQSILVMVIIVTIVRHRKVWISSKRFNLTTTVIRDGLWGYFFNLFGLLVINIRPDWLTGPVGQPSIQWSYVTFSITSTRLLLNIRSGAEVEGSSIPSISIPSSSLSFSSGPVISKESRYIPIASNPSIDSEFLE